MQNESIHGPAYQQHPMRQTHLILIYCHTGLDARPWGIQAVQAPATFCTRQMKIARLSALGTGRLYPSGKSLLQAGSNLGQKCGRKINEKFQTHHQEFSYFLVLCFVLHPDLLLCINSPAFCLLSLLARNNTNIHAPAGIFFSLYFICTSLSWLSSLCLFPLVYYTHNTYIHATGGIRTRNPSKRSAANPHVRPLGHCNRRIEPATFRLVAQCLNHVRYRLSRTPFVHFYNDV